MPNINTPTARHAALTHVRAEPNPATEREASETPNRARPFLWRLDPTGSAWPIFQILPARPGAENQESNLPYVILKLTGQCRNQRICWTEGIRNHATRQDP